MRQANENQKYNTMQHSKRSKPMVGPLAKVTPTPTLTPTTTVTQRTCNIQSEMCSVRWNLLFFFMFFFCFYLIVIVVACWSAASGSRWRASMWRDWPNKWTRKANKHKRKATSTIGADEATNVADRCAKANTCSLSYICMCVAGVRNNNKMYIWNCESCCSCMQAPNSTHTHFKCGGCCEQRLLPRDSDGACSRSCNTRTRREPRTITTTNEPCKARLATQQQSVESICCSCLSCCHYQCRAATSNRRNRRNRATFKIFTASC